MSRFFVHASAIDGGVVTFDAGETRHLSRVLRLGPGDLVVAVDGDGRELTVRLTAVGPRSAAGAIVGARERPAESPLRLTLVQGLPKADKMDVIVRMATELGVARVVPILTERSVPRALPERATARLDRWQRVAREAAKQCGRAVVPEVVAPLPVAAWLAGAPPEGLVVCLWESADVALADLLPPPPVACVTLVVGPEGGLAAREVDALRAAGAIVGGLGPRILRTETAGPAALAVLQARYGDLLSSARP